MSFERMVRGAADNLGAAKALVRSPVYVSIMITCVIMLVVVSIYSPKRLVKTGMYIFICTMFIIFAHNSLLLDEHKKDVCAKDERMIAGAIDIGPTATGGAETEGLSYLRGL